MINGEFDVADDTLPFKYLIVTEMACDDMIVEQNMPRLINDPTVYAMCHGDALAVIAPYVGSARFIKARI